MSEARNEQIREILDILEKNPKGLSRGEIAEKYKFPIENKTLQRRLAALVQSGQVIKTGERRGTKYYPVSKAAQAKLGTGGPEISDSEHPFFSESSLEALKVLEKPPHTRGIVSYNRDFLEDYVPNETFYVSNEIRDTLKSIGQRVDESVAAGTYAKQICERLLIDLSYNSSRLEGNTYSLLDTERLVREGVTAEGKLHEDSVMILNHKEAILFLVENAEDIELNAFTILNLHNLLSQDLLANPNSCGNIRTIEVNIGRSTYTPLSNPHLLRECLELLLLKAKQIRDPFEQSLFLLVHMSYLQAFEDVNKRTARLASNIPFIRDNLCPLSFADISRQDYNAAMLLVYEENDVAPIAEVFCYAYQRSCALYDGVKESIGEVDAYRVQYRQQRKQVMGQVIAKNLHGEEVERYIFEFIKEQNIEEPDRFAASALADLASLHSGAIVGLGITAQQLEIWKEGEASATGS
jgi:Fic family protein